MLTPWLDPSRSRRALEARHVAVLLGLVLVAVALQLVFLQQGLYRISADEAARNILAWRLDTANALEPWIWPPFYKIAIGLALKAWPDLITVPRLLSAVAGIALLLVLADLARRLFADRIVVLVSVALAIAIPHRLIFAVVPLSDIYYFLLLLAALDLLLAALDLLLAWIESQRFALLLATAVLLTLAATVRYEALMVGATLGLYLLYPWTKGRLTFIQLALIGIVLASFPVLWVVDSLVWYGSLDNLGVTSMQAEAIFGGSMRQALKRNPAMALAMDFLWNPVLLAGGLLLLVEMIRRPAVRLWALLAFLPLPLQTGAMLATYSIPGTAPWRLGGLWTLLLLPFTAAALVGAARRLSWRPALPLATLLTALLFLGHSVLIARDGMWDHVANAWRDERQIAAQAVALADEAGGAGGKILVDSQDNLDFLDIIAESGAPDRFIATTGSDPLAVGLYVPMAAYLRHTGADDIIDANLRDRFALRQGGSAAQLSAAGIRVLVVKDAAAVLALEASPLVERVAQHPTWTTFRVRDPS